MRFVWQPEKQYRHARLYGASKRVALRIIVRNAPWWIWGALATIVTLSVALMVQG